ncbi:MAG: ECF-type sigma factor [Akkermansia sp.]
MDKHINEIAKQHWSEIKKNAEHTLNYIRARHHVTDLCLLDDIYSQMIDAAPNLIAKKYSGSDGRDDSLGRFLRTCFARISLKIISRRTTKQIFLISLESSKAECELRHFIEKSREATAHEMLLTTQDLIRAILPQLSPELRELVPLLMAGMEHLEIAKRLNIGKRTVARRISNLKILLPLILHKSKKI